MAPTDKQNQELEEEQMDQGVARPGRAGIEDAEEEDVDRVRDDGARDDDELEDDDLDMIDEDPDTELQDKV